jgi:nitrous oxidase accessory protein NosD
MNKHRSFLINLPIRLLASGAVLAAAGFASAASATAAPNAPIACGTVVTSDVRLRADLLDCEGSALVIGASGVTIDLAGHLIDGTGSGAGIDNSAGHDDISITDGTIRGFLFGVELFQASGARLDRLSVESNVDGVKIARSDAVDVKRVTVTDSVGPGIEVTFSERVVVRRSTVAGSGLGGIVDRFNSDTGYERNHLRGNTGPGLTLDRTGRAAVERNHVAGNDSDGIELSSVDDARLIRNDVVANNGNGISIDRPGNTLTRNHANANQGLGIAAPDGTIDGGGNRATGNLDGNCTGVVCR